MNEQSVVRALAALAQPSRLKIFRQLVMAGQTGMTPSQIADALSLRGTGLSFHLKELANASLITQERNGRYLIYRAAYDAMNDLMAYLTLNCCNGQTCELTHVTDPCENC